MDSCLIKQLYHNPELLYDDEYLDKVGLIQFGKSIGYCIVEGNSFTKTSDLLPDFPEELSLYDMKVLKDKFTE